MEPAVLPIGRTTSALTGAAPITGPSNPSGSDLEAQVVALTRLHDLAMALAGPHDLETALDSILKIAVEFHRAAQGLLYLADRHTGTLKVRASLGFDREFLDAISR